MLSHWVVFVGLVVAIGANTMESLEKGEGSNLVSLLIVQLKESKLKEELEVVAKLKGWPLEMGSKTKLRRDGS